MSRAVEELFEKAAALSVNERAELAGLLLRSIEEPADDGVEDAWAAEIERRMVERETSVTTNPPSHAIHDFRRLLGLVDQTHGGHDPAVCLENGGNQAGNATPPG